MLLIFYFIVAHRYSLIVKIQILNIFEFKYKKIYEVSLIVSPNFRPLHRGEYPARPISEFIYIHLSYRNSLFFPTTITMPYECDAILLLYFWELSMTLFSSPAITSPSPHLATILLPPRNKLLLLIALVM